MDADGTGKTPVYLENGGRSGEKVQKDLDHTNGVSHSVELEKRPPYEQFNPESSSSTQNERKNLLEVGHSSASWKFNTGLSDEFIHHGSSLSSGVEKMTSNEQYEACTTPKRTYMVHHSSAIEISHSRGSSMSPLPWAKREHLYIYKFLEPMNQKCFL